MTIDNIYPSPLLFPTSLPSTPYIMKALRPSSTPPGFYLRAPAYKLRQTFVTLPTPHLQTLIATRTLPYPSRSIYSIIADVPSYPLFLPYCTGSKVTRWSNPDSQGQKWPEEAELRIGWKGIEEKFRSRIYCVPGKVVEAVAGRTKTSLRKEDVAHHNDPPVSPSEEPGSSNGPFGLPLSLNPRDGMFTHLLSRWTLRRIPYQPPPLRGKLQEEKTDAESKECTEVNLAIEFQFQNPVYSAMSSAVADSVAGVLIEAFEGRVRSVLGTKERLAETESIQKGYGRKR